MRPSSTPGQRYAETRRRVADLGGPPRRHGDRLLPPREARTTSRRCRRRASWSAASPSASRAPRPASPARSRSSMTDHLLPTTVVGSYPQPDWLIDRELLGHDGAARAHAGGLARSPSPTSSRRRTTRRCSRSATWSAPASTSSPTARCAARATPTASRPRSMASTSSTRRRSPAAAASRPACRASSARSAAATRSRCATCEFLRANTERTIKITLPGPFTMSRQAQNEFYEDEEELVMDLAAAVNEEAHDLKRAGADIIQIDEPWIETAPELAARYALKAIDRALRRHPGPDRAPHVLRLCQARPRQEPGPLRLPRAARRQLRRADLDRGGAAQARPRRARKRSPARPSFSASSTSATPRSRRPSRSRHASARASRTCRPSA